MAITAVAAETTMSAATPTGCRTGIRLCISPTFIDRSTTRGRLNQTKDQGLYLHLATHAPT
jgi:hypothetical protein